jgi:hypothetical protein
MLGENHLTGEQFGELMAGTTEAAGGELALAEAHLLVCEQCAAELASLREAICFYREASIAYADEELRQRPRWILPARSSSPRSLVPAYWVAAAAMLLTALFPLQVMRRHSVAPAAASVSSVAASDAGRDAQSDEALHPIRLRTKGRTNHDSTNDSQPTVCPRRICSLRLDRACAIGASAADTRSAGGGSSGGSRVSSRSRAH